MNCFNHDRSAAVGLCVMRQKAVCHECVGRESPRLVCRTCIGGGHSRRRSSMAADAIRPRSSSFATGLDPVFCRPIADERNVCVFLASSLGRCDD